MHFRSFLSALVLLALVVSCQELPVEPEPVDLSASKPIAMNDSLLLFEDDSTLFAVIINDSVANNENLTIREIVREPLHGRVRIEGDMLFYAAEKDFFGDDSLHYSVTAGFLPDTATVLISVLGTADNPIAEDDLVSINEDESAGIAVQIGQARAVDVLDNDYDPDGDIITIVSVTTPSNGTATINASGTLIDYTPDENFSGEDRFSYGITDPSARTDAAEVFITVNAVNDAPIAIDDAYQVIEDTELVVVSPGVLTNDIDQDNDPLEAVLVTDVVNGMLTFRADGSFNYLPDNDFFGQDRFQYKISDGTVESDIATVLLNVNNTNAAPIAVADKFTATEDEQFVSNRSVLQNDSDPDGDNIFAVFVDDTQNGLLQFGAGGEFIYTPDPDFFGVDTFTYYASDGSANSVDTEVEITVVNVNDVPVAFDDAYEVVSGASLDIPAPGILDNDEDVDLDDLTAIRVDPVAKGNLIFRGDGSFRYTPNSGASGTDSFTYRARDASTSSSVATVTFTIAGNIAPVAVTDTFTVAVDGVLNVSAPGVLVNDFDDNGDTLEAILNVNPSSGTLDFLSDGSFTYTPNAGFTGEDKFRYQVNDGQRNSTAVDVILKVE